MTEQIAIPSDVDFVVIESVVDIQMGVAPTWRLIGSFADAGRFLDVPSMLLSGHGGIGSVRQVGDAVVEVMIGASDTSYAYVQTKGPVAKCFYHGSVALSADGEDCCSLTYVIAYDQSSLTVEAREELHGRLSGRFRGAAEAMKRVAEAGEGA